MVFLNLPREQKDISQREKENKHVYVGKQKSRDFFQESDATSNPNSNQILKKTSAVRHQTAIVYSFSQPVAMNAGEHIRR